MPLIDVRLLSGVFSSDERARLAEGLVSAVMAVKGESFRDETVVLITELPVGSWYEGGAAASPEALMGRRIEARADAGAPPQTLERPAPPSFVPPRAARG
jgi:4-oxalocrotonate tautomerase